MVQARLPFKSLSGGSSPVVAATSSAPLSTPTNNRVPRKRKLSATPNQTVSPVRKINRISTGASRSVEKSDGGNESDVDEIIELISDNEREKNAEIDSKKSEESIKPDVVKTDESTDEKTTDSVEKVAKRNRKHTPKSKKKRKLSDDENIADVVATEEETGCFAIKLPMSKKRSLPRKCAATDESVLKTTVEDLMNDSKTSNEETMDENKKQDEIKLPALPEKDGTKESANSSVAGENEAKGDSKKSIEDEKDKVIEIDADDESDTIVINNVDIQSPLRKGFCFVFIFLILFNPLNV